MAFRHHGHGLDPAYCTLHPWVREPYPCSVCMPKHAEEPEPQKEAELRNYEVVSIDPLAHHRTEAGVYDDNVERDHDQAERFMLKHNVRWCLIRTWDPAWEKAGDEWFPWQWFNGEACGVDGRFLGHALSVPDPERKIGERS